MVPAPHHRFPFQYMLPPLRNTPPPWKFTVDTVCALLTRDLFAIAKFLAVAASSAEYCQWESFNATCGHNHVILITSAFYGRMRVGRCVPYDYYVGCSTDVFDYLASRCSARQRCVVPIPAPELFKVHPCRKDLVAYMDASYDCVRGLFDLHLSHHPWLLNSQLTSIVCWLNWPERQLFIHVCYTPCPR